MRFFKGVDPMLRFVAAFALSVLMVTLFSPSGRADDADPKKLEGQVEKLLAAYNKDDVRAFFQNWASAVQAIATPMTYDALYKNGAKKSFGDYNHSNSARMAAFSPVKRLSSTLRLNSPRIQPS
jgi:hypothetical protein